jgi:multidrug efflux system membrane fusion protein
MAMMVLGACHARKAEFSPPPPRPVTVAKAEVRNVPLYLDEIGSCVAIESVSVRPQVSGRLTAVHFDDGARVKRGDLLFTIDPLPFRAALDQAQATLAQDEAKLVFARQILARQKNLKDTKAIAAQEYDSALSTVAAAAAQVKADHAAVETARIDLDYTQIESPINGKTGQRLVDVGNIVTSNSTVLVVVKQQSPLHVEFAIAEDDLPRVRRYYDRHGLSAEVSVPAEPGEKRTGRIDFLDNAVQSDTGTVTLRALIANEDRFFWPGQFVNVRLVLDELKDAVLVPAESIQVGQEGEFVFVVKADSTVELRPVQPGQPHEGDVVITDGLKPGETVVVTGQLALAPGAKVNVQPAASARPSP